MASAWGVSWGSSWGVSWGSSITPPVPSSGPGGGGGRAWYGPANWRRKRKQDELFESIASTIRRVLSGEHPQDEPVVSIPALVVVAPTRESVDAALEQLARIASETRDHAESLRILRRQAEEWFARKRREEEDDEDEEMMFL